MAAVNAIAISTAVKVLSSSSSSSIRSELESVRGCFFWLLIACTAIVAIGVLLEVAEDWFPLGKPVLDINTGIFGPSPSIRWRKMVVNLGWKLVMLGVIGEGIFEVATSGADEMLQQFNNTLLTIATEQAGSAAKSAKIAHDEADAASTASRKALDTSKAAKDVAGEAKRTVRTVAEQAGDLRLRMEAASKQLGDLNEAIRIQGPRSTLLIDGQKAFIEAIKPFKPQRVVLVTCAPRQSPIQTDEEFEFELALLNRLVEPRPGSAPGAGWDVGAGGAYSCKASGVGGGVWILYGSSALKAAAEALGGALNKLKISTNTIAIGTDASGYARQKRHPDDFMALCELVASDPTEIYILTGEHPRAFRPLPKP